MTKYCCSGIVGEATAIPEEAIVKTKLTIQAGIIKLTKRKRELLEREYSNLQQFLKGDKSIPLYSANKQQAERYYKKKKIKEYPLSLRNDLINIVKAKAFWFLKIPVFNVRRGIRVPIKPHREIPEGKLCESKIIRKKDKFIAMLTFEFDAPRMCNCKSVLAIDLGERVTATAVLLQNGTVKKVKFLGREVRGIRRHYAWLRKRLQEKKLQKEVKRIGQKEKRAVKDVLHKISKEIVEIADANNAIIALGDLTGIRSRAKGKGRRFNRIVSNMPFYTLSKFIEYKAVHKGIAVITGSEARTSKDCHICGCEGKRRTQGLFVCKYHGEYNADLNGAINYGKKIERDLGYMPLSGASVNMPITEDKLIYFGSLPTCR